MSAIPRKPDAPSTMGLMSERALLWVTLLAVFLGCVFRLSWPHEIEYKADEAFMFERSQNIGVTEPWRTLGMPSGAGSVPNPALSVWLFAGVAKLSPAHTPVQLARVVQALNCVALAGVVLAAFRLAGKERRVWLWAASLAALSPPAILLQRKIWAQSMLPLLCVLMLLAWWQRRRFWGALCWSALAMIAAQVHMTGFLFFAGLLAWTLLFWRDSMNWLGCSAGFVLGGLSAVPWLQAVLPHLLHPTGRGLQVAHWFGPHFWTLWITEGVGVGLMHSFGSDFWSLLRLPSVLGYSTWLVGAAELSLCIVGVVLVYRSAEAHWKREQPIRAQLKHVSQRPFTETGFVCWAGFFAYGVAVSLPDVIMQRHYLLIAFPLPYLWLSKLALGAGPRWRAQHEKLLLAVLLLNVFVSFTMFSYLRQYGGAVHGDFGRSWGAQAPTPPRP